MMKAVRKLPADRVPVWLMRQAGRYMAEYRAVREKTTFLELCRNPSLCAEVMLTAVDRLKVDAAIIFSDLLPILEPMGMELQFSAGEGPILRPPVRTPEDVKRVKELEDLAPLDFVFETVAKTRQGLDESLPVIGFAGAPFTLAAYAIEGGTSRDFRTAKTFMHTQPAAWGELLGKIARSAARYLTAQIEAGAQIVQVFDSWVGCLSFDDYSRFVLPHTGELFRFVKRTHPETPMIYFGTGNPSLLPLMSQTDADVIGVDWRIPIDDAWNAVGDRAVQGNLDPVVLLTDRKTIEREVREIFKRVRRRPGFVFNLGHGILPDTPVENVIYLVETVKELSSS
jgi:uroporphyrinogen decarboxylase